MFKPHPERVAKHRKRFICLATTIFTFVGIGHALRLYYGWSITIVEWAVPRYISWLAVLLALSMVIMGAWYWKRG